MRLVAPPAGEPSTAGEVSDPEAEAVRDSTAGEGGPDTASLL